MSCHIPWEYTYVYRQLTHGTFDRTTQSGRVAETWRGGVEEVRKKLDALTTNMVYRGGKAPALIMHLGVYMCKVLRYILPIQCKCNMFHVHVRILVVLYIPTFLSTPFYNLYTYMNSIYRSIWHQDPRVCYRTASARKVVRANTQAT